jgi:peptidoglycan/LPS O-acetylase OafA/YrhL
MLVLDPTHLFQGALGTTVANGWARVLVAGVPATALLAAATLGPEPRLRAPLMPFMPVGDASYSLYLLHPVALIVLEKLAQKLPAFRLLPGPMLVIGTVLAAVVIALVAFRWGERPMTAYIARHLITRPRPTRPQPA